MHTDALNRALGGVLVQEGHPVAFESRKLNAAEQRYSAHENEMTADIHCVETRGAHSFRPRVRQGPTPPTGTSTPGPNSAAACPSATTGPSAAAAGASPSVLVVHTSVAAAVAAPTVVQSPAAADVEGSSSVAPA